MNGIRQFLQVRCLGVFILLATLCLPLTAKDSLTWNNKTDRVDASIETWPLSKVLEEVSEATGWQIYLEPGAEEPVSTKFRNINSGEALTRLLGKLNYALLPQPDGTSKLLVFRDSKDKATQRVQSRTKSKSSKSPIPNELIVILKPGAKESIEDIAKRFGAKIVGRLDEMKAYRLEFPDEASAKAAREALEGANGAGNSDVATVDSNFIVPPPPPAQAVSDAAAKSLNLKAITAPDGHNMIIGLVDTAIQPNATPYKDFLLPAQSVVGDVQPGNEVPTHGTLMLSPMMNAIAQSLGPDQNQVSIRILPVTIYSKGESTTMFDAAVGVYNALKGGSSIVNMSFGGQGESKLLESVIATGSKNGVLFTAAAGNEPTAEPTYPAAYNGVIAVTAAGKNGTIATYANYGDFVDIVAPGNSISRFYNQNYISSGTSVSSAYIAGRAAGLAVTSGFTLQQVGATLMNTYGRTATK